MQTTISQAVADKAAKIIGEGRIEWVKGHVYRVQGDSGTYTVHVSFPQEVVGACDCPAGRNKIDRRTQAPCSHLIAACAWELTHPVHASTDATDPFEGLGI